MSSCISSNCIYKSCFIKNVPKRLFFQLSELEVVSVEYEVSVGSVMWFLSFQLENPMIISLIQNIPSKPDDFNVCHQKICSGIKHKNLLSIKINYNLSFKHK